jgi:hypothetical protein
MIRNYIYKLSQLVLVVSAIISLTSCRETLESLFPSEIAEGEEVMFTTSLPSGSTTRTTQAEYKEQMNAYKTVNEAYEFTIDMFKENVADPIGSGIYRPASKVTKDEEGNITKVEYDEVGTLVSETNKALYWSSTIVPYAFEATAGSETLSADQSTKEYWLKQDRLKGYGYIQMWDNDNNSPIDNLDTLNYHTAKQWKELNSRASLVSDEADYKKIPLYLRHQRSLITIILKAGEGVSRKALAFDMAENDLSANIYSYTKGASTTSSLEINPLASEAFIDYAKDKNGAAETGVSTTRYDAIVEPFDYSDIDNSSTAPIAKISLSGQHYSFYADNDYDFSKNKKSYNLEAGKHLTITVTLSRDSRKVMMTAYIEDWTEEVTNTICDDYGNEGEPIKISTRDELIAFLGDANKNKPGHIALITKNIELETPSETNDGGWDSYNHFDLNCTLSLGGNTLISNHRFLTKLGNTASLQNGTIQIGGLVNTAIAEANEGTIDDIKVTADGTTACATIAGAVISNTGSISRCHSSLKVANTSSTEIIGGIAATSLSNGNTAVIDACTVTNRVSGGAAGGGIVGRANGYVTNNTFEYGITLLQKKDTHKNIVGEIEASHSLTAENNAWPTIDDDLGLTNATAPENRYTGIIDCEDEMKTSTGIDYNQATYRYRLAQDITISSTIGDVAYELNGNGKQLTTSAMIFKNITGNIHDLKVFVIGNLIAENNGEDTDAIAPLAYAVIGSSAEISNIAVKMAKDTYIQASNPAGIVAWARGGATIKNCEATVDLQAWVKNPTTSKERKYVGGIVSTVSMATITQCVFHSASKLTTRPDITGATVIYYGGIVGGVGSWQNETPELVITDCTSFCDSYVTKPEDDYHGAIVGYSKDGDKNATKDCQGNWWPDCKGVASCFGSIEAAIGKRNAIVPSENDN